MPNSVENTDCLLLLLSVHLLVIRVKTGCHSLIIVNSRLQSLMQLVGIRSRLDKSVELHTTARVLAG